MNLTKIIHSNKRYETKFKNLNESIINETDINILNSEINYLKNKRNHGRLKYAINQTYRKINYSTVDNVIEKLQKHRNKLINSNGINKYQKIEEMIDGKYNYKLENRFDEIKNYISKNELNSENEKDSIRYVLSRLDSNYMKNKSLKNKQFKINREKLKKKLESKLYYKKKITNFKNIKYAVGLAASLLFGSLFLNNNPPSYTKPIVNKIEIIKEKNIIQKVAKYEITKTYSDYKVVVDKSKQSMYVLGNYKENWNQIKEYKISTGKFEGNKTKKGDNKTPEGNFKIIQKQNSSNWYYQNEKAYGPYFLRLNSNWEDIGIHGTNKPEKIGQAVSHGCIRMLNQDLVEFLEDYAKLGTKIEIKN